ADRRSSGMSTWLDPLRRVLDEAPARVAFFFRDDDVGRADERLHPLLDLFSRHAVPIDLAVIPQALAPAVADVLCTRIARASTPIGVHWLRRSSDAPRDLALVAGRLAGAAHDRPAGIMLHHEHMDTEELERLGELLTLLARHARARCCTMESLAAEGRG